MLHDVLFALWFFLPAGVANMVPIFAAHIPLLKPYDAPVDFGKTFRGKRIFGAHKTWRGFIVGIIFATIVLGLQQLLYVSFEPVRVLASEVDYSAIPLLIVGPLFGLGALLGDAIESFFKRQKGVQPGDGWFPWDQTDYIIGGSIAVAPFIQLSLWQYVWLILLWLVVHLISSYIGYRIGVKDKPI